jgi:hypothetical protein
MSYITDEMYKQLISGGDKGLLKLIEEKHCNENKQEHANIYIGNRKLQYLITFDRETWNIKQADPEIIGMLKTNTNQLIGKYEDLKDKLDKKTTKAFIVFLKKINYDQDKCHDIDDIDNIEDMNDYTKSLLKDTKLLLFNKRNMCKQNTDDEDQIMIDT